MLLGAIPVIAQIGSSVAEDHYISLRCSHSDASNSTESGQKIHSLVKLNMIAGGKYC